MNMVSTIDGKTVSGEVKDSVLDLGSKVDHELMDRIESACDMVLIGGSTYRANPKTWSPRATMRGVVSASLNLDFETAYLRSGQAFVLTTPEKVSEVPADLIALPLWEGEEAWRDVLRALRESFGVEKLLVLGGSELNAQLLRLDVVDELFLTLAPKIKLGRNLPTYAGGDPLSQENIQNYRLIESHVVGNELFVRYARN